MTNLVENVKHEIKSVVEKALAASIAKGELAEVPIPEILVEVPREKEHGDFSANTAMLLTKQLKKAPREIAQVLIKNMDFTGTFIEKVECAGPGFINFYLSNKWLYKSLDIVVSENEDYGRINIGNGKKVMVEYVSANPTGPLHMGNARGGALGDCIASVLDAAGYDVTREFYINDAGNQIEKFGISLEARYLQLILGEDAVTFPEDGYMGEDIIDHMKDYIALYGDKLVNAEPSKRQKELVDFALPRNIENIKNALSSYGVNHDVWFSEKTLHDSGAIDEAIKMLIEKGATVEKEGALWLKASVIGAEKDEVLVRNNGIPTYFAADIAYHMNKFIKRGFDRVINLWGADHHGHVSRMKGAMAALGIDPSRLDVVLFQLVRLYRNGEIARMSKRTGRTISLVELLEELSVDDRPGKDAARYYFNMIASGVHLDFHLDLAVSQSKDNPVYYVQYAHARICSILKRLAEEGIQMPQKGEADLTNLTAKEELQLIKRLAEYPEEIRISAATLEPSRLTRYATDIAALFHSFYTECHVKNSEEKVMKARIILVEATRIVLRNVLTLLKISAPEKM